MEETMRLSGHSKAFAMTPQAHRLLLGYLADARAALNAEPDGDETIRDMESTVGDRLISASVDDAPVTETTMRELLDEIGTVTAGSPATSDSPRRGRFWCRIDEGKWFGGICLGIAARSELRVDWTRVVVLLLLLVTGGLIGFVYLALLIFLPRVSTVEEYERLRDSPATPR